MSEQANIPSLPEKPKNNNKALAIGAGVLVVALAAGAGIYAATSGNDSGDKLTTIKVGTTENSEPYWNQLIKVGKDKYGLDIKVVPFTDYTQANPALAQGQIDVNQFQHLQFLANYNVEANQNLTPVGSTYIVPLGLYSKKHKSINEFPQGAKVAIPNDAVNQARALLVLQSAGLLKLKDGGNSLSTPADIEKSASKVTVQPVDAAQTAAALPSVDGSVVNNNFAADAKLNPNEALFKDDIKAKEAQPYINVVVARKDDANNPTYKKFVEAYHDPSVTKLIKEQSKNTTVIVNEPVSKLQSTLADIEKDIKAKK